MSESRFLVATKYFPPYVGGSSIMMDNLLRSYKGEVLAVAGFQEANDPDFVPGCPCERMSAPRIDALRKRWNHLGRFRLFRWHVSRYLKKQMKKYRPTVVMGTFPDPDFFLGAFHAARELNIPFYTYMHDLWEENATGPRHEYSRNLARQWERRVLMESKRVFCITDSQGEYYKEKYGIPSYEVLPHAVAHSAIGSLPTGIGPAGKDRTVLFVGMVSRQMNEDALKVLAKATELLPADVKFRMATTATPETLAQLGVVSSRLVAGRVPKSEIQQVQRDANILLAPLSFKNGSDSEVRTVFSTKLLEYMSSGRPILVFAPSWSFHSQSAQKFGWGLVVDKDDPQALAEGMRRLLEDEKLAAQLVQGALAEARRRDAEIVAAGLKALVDQDSQGA